MLGLARLGWANRCATEQAGLGWAYRCATDCPAVGVDGFESRRITYHSRNANALVISSVKKNDTMACKKTDKFWLQAKPHKIRQSQYGVTHRDRL